VSSGLSTQDAAAFTLTDEILWRGLCADLKDAEDGGAEFRRRANEVAIILRAAGVSVGLGA
jgi:bifunctional enzyme CysN/CysC